MDKTNLTVLEQMQNNFNNINNVKMQNTPQNNVSNNIPINNKMNSFSNLMPLINALSGGKNMDMQSLLKNTDISKVMANNPMLSQIMTMLPNAMKTQSVKQQKIEKNEPKIDSFIKADDYNIE